MADIVARLRDQQTKFMTPILGQAADEIEELRHFKRCADARFSSLGMDTMSARLAEYPDQYPRN